MKMSAETKYQEIIKQLNIDIEQAVKDACDKVHSEIIPYINDDTESNAVYRAHDIVNAIIRGDVELDGDTIKCLGWKTKLTPYQHDRLVDKLASLAGNKAQELKIERLERAIEDLLTSR